MADLPDYTRAGEIERTLLQHKIYSNVPRNTPKQVLNDNTRNLLREWLRALAIPETKIAPMSDDGLQGAFHAGRNWAIKRLKEEVDDFGPRRKPPGHVDIGDLLEAEELDLGLKNEFDDENNRPRFGQPAPQAPTPDPNVPHDAPRNIVVDERAVRRAAESIILPRLANMSAELLSKVNSRLDETAKTTLDTLRGEIDTLATQAAKAVAETIAYKIISENLPRRLEIWSGDKLIRELPAEPRHEAFDRILKRLVRGQHVYIVGPAGTGKTHLFKQLAAALGYDLDTEFFPIDQSLTKFDVKGYKGPTGEYVETLVRRAVEFGGFMAIDEGDMWAAAALGALNSILANDYGAFPDGTVKVHPKFRCVLAANTFGHGATMQYQGRNPLDAASLDRFAFVVVGYDETLEKQLYGNGPWVQYVQKVRKAVEQLKLTHIVSMRASQRGLSDLADGDPADEVCFAQLWRNLDPDTVAKIKSIAGVFTTDENLENLEKIA